MEKISPFSTSHNYTLEWNVITTSDLPSKKALSYQHSKEEDFVLRSLATIGCIGSKQLMRAFLNNNKSKLKKMMYSNKIIRHKMIRGKTEIPLFTVGVTGIKQIGLDRSYINKWKTYSQKDVLQRLVAVQLYTRLLEIDPDAEMMETVAEPYTVAIMFRSRVFHVLVLRDNENLMEYAFKENAYHQRTILIAEAISFLNNIENIWKPYANMTRVTTDQDILHSNIEDLFYMYDEIQQEWIKENIREKIGS